MAEAATDPGEAHATLHASTVCRDGRALLIKGPSGTGKSALAMQLIGLGARLVADDRTRLWRADGGLRAGPPDAIAGLIEVRGLGLLRLPHADAVPLCAVVDMAAPAPERLPQARAITLLGCALPLLSNLPGAHFAAALMQILAGATLET